MSDRDRIVTAIAAAMANHGENFSTVITVAEVAEEEMIIVAAVGILKRKDIKLTNRISLNGLIGLY